ncbi:MAG: IMP dehydrogenase [Nitrospirae bacterium]|nr:IMP dehydrogenase [Nitrospirota bacterium]
MKTFIPPDFRVYIEHERCRRCKRCLMNCSFDAYTFQDRVTPDDSKCVGCNRCAVFCPEHAITISNTPIGYREHPLWSMKARKDIWKQSETGGVLLTGMGNDQPFRIYWDHIVIDACQVTNPSIDPLREPMELRTYLGKKPDAVSVKMDRDGKLELATELLPQIEINTPIIFAAMSYGAVSLNVQKSIAMAAKEFGTLWNTGEGGLHEDLYHYGSNTIVQVASGRFGVSSEYLKIAVASEIKIGQGAKPGIGGHLPGEKVNLDVSKTRMIPQGTDALSPAPQHDIYSIEDLRQLIYAIKEANGYKPVGVKIAAVHNVAAISSGIARAGADWIYIDGFRGGTGASPTIIRDHIGIPIELALAAVDERLRQEGIRNSVSIIAAGGIRNSGDVAKAIALGADTVAIGTAALVALGCSLCQKCYTGNCAWGITTQRPELVRRIDPEVGAERIYNLLRGWSLELKEILGALGLNSIESLRGSRERLRGIGLNEVELRILGIKHAGE